MAFKFEWVIENLCKNAIDAMEGAGKITITIENQEKQVVIDFTDTGKGIAARNLKSVFELYEQKRDEGKVRL